MKNVICFMLVLLISLGCVQEQKNVVEIGAILPLTGYASFNGNTCKQGLDLAIKTINEAQKDYTFEVIYEDSKSSAKDAFTSYKKLRSMGVDYFIGFGGQFLLSFAPATKGDDVILFAAGTPNMNILDLTDRCFRIYPNVEMVTDEIIDFFKEKNIDDVAIVYLQNEAYAMYGRSLSDKVKQSGKNVVYSEGYDPSCRDFKNIINKLSDKHVDCVYVAGAGENTAIFTHQLFTNPKTQGISVIGDMSLSNSSNLQVIGEITSPIYIVDNFMTEDFVKEFENEYASAPNAFPVYAYTIPYILYDAFNKVDKDNVKAVYDYIRDTEFDTVAGKISFDKVTAEPKLNLIINTIE